MDVKVVPDRISSLGKLKIASLGTSNYSDDEAVITFDESQLDDDEGTSQ